MLESPRWRIASDCFGRIRFGSLPGTAKSPVPAALGLLSPATRHLYESQSGVPIPSSSKMDPSDQMSKDQAWDCRLSFVVGSGAIDLLEPLKLSPGTPIIPKLAREQELPPDRQDKFPVLLEACTQASPLRGSLDSQI